MARPYRASTCSRRPGSACVPQPDAMLDRQKSIDKWAAMRAKPKKSQPSPLDDVVSTTRIEAINRDGLADFFPRNESVGSGKLFLMDGRDVVDGRWKTVEWVAVITTEVENREWSASNATRERPSVGYSAWQRLAWAGTRS